MYMEDYISSETSNINEKWLQNIYENIQKLEENERIIREGCSSVLDFVQIPLNNREIIIGLTQYKTLKFFLTEFNLLLADLTPILKDDEAKDFEKVLKEMNNIINLEKLFLDNRYDIKNNLTSCKPTQFFYSTLDILHTLKVDLFKKIKHILYLTK